jgi:hypothetical protein
MMEVTGSSEPGYGEIVAFVHIRGKFLDQLSNYKFFRMDPAPWSMF